MTRESVPQFVLHGILSDGAIGCPELAQLFATERGREMRTTSAMKLHVLEDGRYVSANLAKVSWIQEERFGVELPMMGTDERDRWINS
jgi:hypothetical protein